MFLLLTLIWWFFVILFYYFYKKNNHQFIDLRKIFKVFVGLSLGFALVNVLCDLLLYSFPFLSPDSKGYCYLILNYHENGSFVFHPDRRIFYQLFLFAIWMIFHNLYLVIVIQAILFIVNAIIGYKISILFTRSKNFSMIVLIVLLFSWPLFKPFHYLLTGSLFILFISVITFFLVEYATQQKSRSLFGLSLFLGFSLLLRPSAKIFIFIPVLISGFILYQAIQNRTKFDRQLIVNIIVLIFPALIINITGDLFHSRRMPSSRSYQFENRQIFCAGGFLVDFTSSRHKAAKDSIREEIENFNKKYSADKFFGYFSKRPDYDYLIYGKPYRILRKNFPRTYHQIAKEIAIEGILKKPHIFLSKVIVETIRIYSHIYYPNDSAVSIEKKFAENISRFSFVTQYISNPLIAPASKSEKLLIHLREIFNNVNKIVFNSYIFISIPYLLSIFLIIKIPNGVLRFIFIIIYVIPFSSNLVHSVFVFGSPRYSVYALTPQIVLALYTYQVVFNKLFRCVEKEPTKDNIASNLKADL